MQPNPSLSLVTCLALILVLLALPLTVPLNKKPAPLSPRLDLSRIALMLAFLISLYPLWVHAHQGVELVVFTWTSWAIAVNPVYATVALDQLTVLFIPIALYVGWAIVEFANWYMAHYLDKDQFAKYLLAFLISMIILVTANNMYQLLIGWEAVGLMSFLLIGWWRGRGEANVAALQALLYNRLGDIGILLTIVWLNHTYDSSDIQTLLTWATKNPVLATIPAAGLILAAMGKSAQFGLHPWLPAAMEGPTPVSALLHSSTMVVAGIFLLIRVSTLVYHSPACVTACLWIGSLTTVYAATCALTQHDIKKIVAFSTASQLGLMMVAIGLKQPEMAFLHICTHAFFKAMLFLCSGGIIHCLAGEQDIRKMGGIGKDAPILSTCFTVGSLALAGFPYLAGFYSKDAIIEALNTSYVNVGALGLTLVATSFTAIYSLRLIFYVVLGFSRYQAHLPINEDHPGMTRPIRRLAWGSIIAGLVIADSILPTYTSVLTMPPMAKLAALLLSILSLFIGLEASALASNPYAATPRLLPYRFAILVSAVPPIIHRILPTAVLGTAQALAKRTLDRSWLEMWGPEALSRLQVEMASVFNNTRRNSIKTSLLLFLLTIVVATLISQS